MKEEGEWRTEKKRVRVLTRGVLSLAVDPFLQQHEALSRKGVGVLHTDMVDLIHREVQLTSHLCNTQTNNKDVILIYMCYGFTAFPNVFVMIVFRGPP